MPVNPNVFATDCNELLNRPAARLLIPNDLLSSLLRRSKYKVSSAASINLPLSNS